MASVASRESQSSERSAFMRIKQYVYYAADLFFLGILVRWLCAYGTEWRFGKFWTPTPILKEGVPVDSIEGMLAVSGALPYLYLMALGVIVSLVALLFILSYRDELRLKRFRRELEAIGHLPDGEYEAARDKLLEPFRQRAHRRW